MLGQVCLEAKMSEYFSRAFNIEEVILQTFFMV